MIDFMVDEASEAAVLEELGSLQARIVVAAQEGMLEAMQGLAAEVGEKLQGNPIQTHTGALLDAVLDSPTVTTTGNLIRGTVSSDVGKKHIGLWLEEGIHVRATAGKLFGFGDIEGEIVFAYGHAAFEVEGKPFLNPSLEEYQGTILEIMREHVGEVAPVTAGP